MGGAALMMPTGVANADATPLGLRELPTSANGVALSHSKLPSGAERATRGVPRAGAQGPAFETRKGGTAPKTRIIGGTVADPASHPGVVAVQTLFWAEDEFEEPQQWVSTCTGTVLSPTKVLTAAHCSVDFPLGTTWVTAGRADVSQQSTETGGFVARVASTWTHQGFNLAAMYADPNIAPKDDVTVLTLKDALPASYTPVTLSAQGDQAPYAEGNSATIVGYGTTSPSGGGSGILYSATVPMQSDATCLAAYSSGYDANRMTCAGTPNEANPAAGVDTCHGDSGGPLFVGGVQVGITDWGKDPCASSYGVYERISYYRSLVDQDLARSGLINLDWTGDGHSDLMVRHKSGRLLLAGGTGLASDGYGGFNAGDLVGFNINWLAYSKLFRVTNWNSDGTPAIMARDGAGRLFQYKSDGKGNLNETPVQVGTGWNKFTDIMVTNNWMGDGQPNLMGRTSTGDLYIYTSNGMGGWKNPKGTKIGTGWNMFNTVLTPGSWLGDGKQTLIGRTPKGELRLYISNGAGGWVNGAGTMIGTGWGMFSTFMSPGDWNGDNMIDMIGVTPAGAVRLYTSNGKGQWLTPKGQQIDQGWTVFDRVF
jgi:hypothetical protein